MCNVHNIMHVYYIYTEYAYRKQSTKPEKSLLCDSTYDQLDINAFVKYMVEELNCCVFVKS